MSRPAAAPRGRRTTPGSRRLLRAFAEAAADGLDFIEQGITKLDLRPQRGLLRTARRWPAETYFRKAYFIQRFQDGIQSTTAAIHLNILNQRGTKLVTQGRTPLVGEF
ncbi:hypothetical protein ACRAVF_31980 [Bradyrhizobium oligotrophicum S58]